MQSALTVAPYFLALSDPEVGDTISNLKLQKLLYYGQGFHLALTGDPLFQEPIEAWRHGPVVRQAYARYADFRSGSIPPPDEFDPGVFTDAERSILDEVYQVYGQYSAWRLRDMTHDEAPWRDAWEAGAEIIPHGAMREYFQTLLVDGQEA